jgi:hypothetical protein
MHDPLTVAFIEEDDVATYLKYREVRSLRRNQSCARCYADLPPGDWARYVVYVINDSREFFTEYLCFNCDKGNPR